MSAAAAPAAPSAPRLPNAFLFGTGEYTTGFVAGRESTSDKPMGVVALTFFDLRARGLIGNQITLCGRNPARADGIRQHMLSTIGAAYGLDTSCAIVPSPEDPHATAASVLAAHSLPGDIAVVTTPDSTHAALVGECLRRGLNVLVAKPVVRTLGEHWDLLREAEEWHKKALAAHAAGASTLPPPRPLLLAGEFHKRFDPLYADASARISSGSLGALSFVNAYMSQPRSQLATFSAWLGKGSPDERTDISYYLNAHHVDLVSLATWRRSTPLWVTALAASGEANKVLNEGKGAGEQRAEVEDTITLVVQYEHRDEAVVREEVEREKREKTGATAPAAEESKEASAGASESAAAASSSSAAPAQPASSSFGPSFGIGVFTSSWIAPRSDVHSQQRFHFLGARGEVSVDQAHRGYQLACDDTNKGLQSLNPLFMRYQPSDDGRFVGQQGYGYQSFAHFVESVRGLPSTAISSLALLDSHASLFTTAILQAARLSLDEGNRKVHIRFDDKRRPIKLE